MVANERKDQILVDPIFPAFTIAPMGVIFMSYFMLSSCLHSSPVAL